MDEVTCKLGEALEVFDRSAKVWGGDGGSVGGFHAKSREQIPIALRTPTLGVGKLAKLS